MKEDFQKFMELVKTDEALQKKLEEAGTNYDGEQTEEAVFHAVLEPVAKDAGFSFTLDDMKQSIQELGMDEMSQVAGGLSFAGGLGFFSCTGRGGGFGGGGTDGVGGFCIFVGYGSGEVLCVALGGGETEENRSGGIKSKL